MSTTHEGEPKSRMSKGNILAGAALLGAALWAALDRTGISELRWQVHNVFTAGNPERESELKKSYMVDLVKRAKEIADDCDFLTPEQREFCEKEYANVEEGGSGEPMLYSLESWARAAGDHAKAEHFKRLRDAFENFHHVNAPSSKRATDMNTAFAEYKAAMRYEEKTGRAK